MTPEETATIIRMLDGAGCFVMFGALTVYMARLILPTFDRLIESHERHITQIIELVKAVDKQAEID